MAYASFRFALLIAVTLALPGCRLIDQRSFESAGHAPGAAQLSRGGLPPLPLATIRFDRPDFDFRPDLEQAVLAAQARKPDASFDVVAPIPTSASEAQQNSYATQGAQDAREVADALQSDGVPPDHIHLGLRGDAGRPPREVQVYVR